MQNLYTSYLILNETQFFSISWFSCISKVFPLFAMIPFDFLCTTRVGYRRESEVERLTHTPWGNKTTTIVQHVRENEQPNVFGRCGREINQRNKNRQREIHEIFSGHDNKTKDDRHNDNNKHQPNIGWLEWLERAAGTRAQAAMKKEKKKLNDMGTRDGEGER